MKRLLAALVRRATAISDRVTEDEVGVHAAHASFFMMISAIPCLIIILSIARRFVTIDAYTAVEIAEEFIPDSGMSIVVQIIYELFYTSQSLPLLSVTALTAIWSGSRGFMALEIGLSKIVSGAAERGYIKSRLLAYLYTVLFILIVNLSLLILVFGNRIEYMLAGRFSLVERFISSAIDTRYIILPALLTLYFAFVYKVLPGLPLRSRRPIFPGALASAVGWLVFSQLYAYYIDNFTDYSYVYGSIAAVVLLMLWLYFCMNILLLGAELNEYLRRRKEEPAGGLR